ncbi:MAG: alkyl hydroperoxide reductase [Gammaproteobacteria bacterium]|nr:alkyl hydroperoxide reductase [Gammaproteobacteria bacterium]
MELNDIRNRIPDYAKDLRLNLGSVLTPQGAPGLSETQIWGTALTAAITSRNTALTRDIETLAREQLDDETIDAVRAAAAIMGMNNIYYRFLHLVEDDNYATMPARLRMNVIARPGIDKKDFELYSLAASSITGCGKCIVAHERNLRQHEVSAEAVQSAVRIASVIHGVAIVLEQTGDNVSTAAAA